MKTPLTENQKKERACRERGKHWLMQDTNTGLQHFENTGKPYKIMYCPNCKLDYVYELR